MANVTIPGLTANTTPSTSALIEVSDSGSSGKSTLPQAVNGGLKGAGTGAIQAGGSANASATNSTAIGINSAALAAGSTAIGAGSNAAGVTSFAGGTGAKAVATGGTALGLGAQAIGQSAIAIGTSTLATGNLAIAEGQNANAVGANSMALGTNSLAVADRNIAIGTGANATGNVSLAIGNTAVASAAGAVALGFGAQASTNAVSIGTGTVTSGEGVAIGFGAQAAVADKSVAIGYNANAAGQDAVAAGYGSSAGGTVSVSIGQNSKASASGTTALGGRALATDFGGTAFGYRANAGGYQATAVGYHTIASGTNSMAIGFGAQATAAGSIALGNVVVATANTLGIGWIGGTTGQVLVKNANGWAPGDVGVGTVNDAITAAGTVQANATAISAQINTITTCPTNAGVRLPVAASAPIGSLVSLLNTTANTVKVWPDSGAAIGALAADANDTLNSGASVSLRRTAALQWRAFAALVLAIWLGGVMPALGQLGPQPGITVNNQTGTTYTVLNSDCGKVVSTTNAASIAVTLPQAGSNGNFVPGCTIWFSNNGAGNATITPTTSTIGGRASFVLQEGGGVAVTSFNGNWTPTAGFPAVIAVGGLIDGSQVTTATASIQGTIKSGDCISMGGTGNKFASVSDSCRTSGLAVPVCPNGVGCPSTATPDIYPLPFAAAIPASTVPSVQCKVSPAATVTFLVKKWTAGNPASSSTLCTGSISTACALSACSISSTSFSAGDGLSVEATEASPDATAVISVSVPFLHQ